MLSSLSIVYAAAVGVRNLAYDRGWLTSTRAAVPVISIGNISAGGTGKSPLVVETAAHLLARGIRAAVVTRGYRRETRGTFVVSDGGGAVATARAGGDEPVMMARRLPGLVVIADEIRVRGCAEAVARHGAEVIVLDDAFQHRACARDCDIVTIDAAADPYGDALLPGGRLREPLRNLARADALVLTRCNQAPDWRALADRLAAEFGLPVVPTAFEPRRLVRFGSGDERATTGFNGKTVVSFCGIGSPASFRATIDALGMRTAHHLTYRDHHRFRSEDIGDIIHHYRATNADGIITTEKDAQRLAPFVSPLQDLPVWYLEMGIRFPDGGERYRRIVDAVAGKRDGRVESD